MMRNAELKITSKSIAIRGEADLYWMTVTLSPLVQTAALSKKAQESNHLQSKWHNPRLYLKSLNVGEYLTGLETRDNLSSFLAETTITSPQPTE